MAQPSPDTTFLEHLGVIAWVLGIFYLVLRKLYSIFVGKTEDRALARPEPIEEHDEEIVVPKKPVSPPPPPPRPTPPKRKPVEAAPAYEFKKKEQISRGAALIKRQASRKDLFIIDEIIKPPVSIRKEHLP